MKKKNNYSSFLFSFLIICIYNLSKCDDTVKCPEGFIAKDNAFCPTIMNCPGSLIYIHVHMYNNLLLLQIVKWVENVGMGNVLAVLMKLILYVLPIFHVLLMILE